MSDGVTHYELSGPDGGEVVVLVGGLTVPLFYWDGFAAELRDRGFRTLAYSAYGRGYSDRVQARYDEALFVRQLVDLTDALDVSLPQHLVATSLGAVVAMAHLGRRPSAARTLTLIAPAGLAERPALPAWPLRHDRVARAVGRRLGHRMLRQHLGHNVRDPHQAEQLAAMVLDAYRFEGSMYALLATLRDLRMAGRTDLYQQARGSELPTMLAWGSEDQVIPADQLELARTLLEPEVFHLIDQSGHMAPFERPREVADLFVAFAASHPERIGP
ncbi:alpha/beta fold hydrolase [Actinoplanes subtropicus]|uniref:alpha/beta fold hydrolase n=1 Tax=Actinoplanes subtropicus TaxID=543632 RepID=UPI001B80D673|nr:alpha/beta fold hydrolase [Actinoplanes subtropicus]